MQGLPASSDFSSLMDLTGGDPWSLASTRAKRVYSREFKIHFIREVRLRPNLWDPSHEFHCRQDMSKKTWKELAAVMNEEFPEFPIESKDIRKLYKNLRDMYKVRRNEAREAKGEETPGTRWEYYSDMSFLSHIIDMMEDQRADSCQLDVLNVIEDNDDKSTDSDEKSSTRVLLDADQAKALDVTALFGEPASSTSSSQHNGLVKEEPQEFDFQLFSEPTPSEKATGTPKRYDRLGRLLPPSRWPRPRTFPLKRKSVTSRAAAAKLPINTQAPLSSCQQSSNAAAPAATLPPVISFMLDKYNAFKNRSPDLANQFENELLKVVINFNDQKTDNAK